MTVTATQTRTVLLSVPGADTLHDATARLTDPGDVGGGFTVLRDETGGWAFTEVKDAEGAAA